MKKNKTLQHQYQKQVKKNSKQYYLLELIKRISKVQEKNMSYERAFNFE